jgi:hypothetical protein
MSPGAQVVCAGCRCAYSALAWSELAVVSTLTTRELRAYVVEWDERRVIEVRACATCGRAMARAIVRGAA